MTNLSSYLNESLTKTQRLIVGSIIIDMLKDSKLTPEQIKKMIMNLELNIIQDINNYIYDTDKTNAISYVSDKDEFLVKDNKEKIVNKLVDYFCKFVV